MKLRLDHIQLAIPEGGEDAARAFWTGQLGCKEIKNPRPSACAAACGFASAMSMCISALRLRSMPPKRPTRPF